MAKKTATKKPKAVAVCTPVSLPRESLLEAARVAWDENPANKPQIERYAFVSTDGETTSMPQPTPEQLAVITSKYWRSGGVDLSVSFMDNPSQACRRMFFEHANAWGAYGNIRFRETQGQGQVRLSRGRGGYWSYLGTDILSIPANQPTMNLEGFSERTPESEWKRVCRHECGHSCGFPHEQLRAAIVNRIDPQRAIAYFRQTSGWDQQTTVSNVLTPLEERTIVASSNTDETSLMCYSLPASIMRDGIAVPGGLDISATDKVFVASIYPLASGPVDPGNPPTTDDTVVTLIGLNAANQEVARFKR